MTTHGFILGKFMPPHAGHVSLCKAAAAMVDQLTILVCSLPDDDVPGTQRLEWMRNLFPDCRVIACTEDIPQAPDDSPKFWSIWRRIVKEAHPEPIDLVFAGKDYGRELASHVGGTFIPLGARIFGADMHGLGGLSGTAIRDNPSAHWKWLPTPVRQDWIKTVVLHGVESTGKSTLAAQLAERLNTNWVPEYGRSHCEVHGTDLTSSGLKTIAAAQQAMIDAAKEWSGPVLISDTDWLMTCAWHEMMLGTAMDVPEYEMADLYIHLPPDIAWVADGTRVYGSDEERARFDAICRNELKRRGAIYIVLDGPADARVEKVLSLIAAL